MPDHLPPERDPEPSDGAGARRFWRVPFEGDEVPDAFLDAVVDALLSDGLSPDPAAPDPPGAIEEGAR